jgi:toxin FitB
MKSVGIREAKGRLSELARAAANGEPTLLTDYGKPRAVITSIEEGGASHAAGFSDVSKFKQALLAVPHPLDVDF